MSKVFLDYFTSKAHSFSMSRTSKKQAHGGKRAGAGRKSKYVDPVMVAALIPAKLRDKLDRIAESKGISRSQALVEAIRQFK